jgi:CRP-like cAMP-binding protein
MDRYAEDDPTSMRCALSRPGRACESRTGRGAHCRSDKPRFAVPSVCASVKKVATTVVESQNSTGATWHGLTGSGATIAIQLGAEAPRGRITSSHRHENALLAAFSSHETSLLMPSLREIRLERGEVLYESGSLINYVYFPCTAVISQIVEMEGGEWIASAVIGREAAAGIAVALHRTHAISRAVVLLAGTAARVPASDFRDAARQSALLLHLAGRCDELLIRQILQAAGCNALHDAQARLCRWLLECSDCAGAELALTQDVLAQMLGVRRTTITQVAQRLQSLGVIGCRRGVIQILDRRSLEASACGCYRAIQTQKGRLLPGAPNLP